MLTISNNGTIHPCIGCFSCWNRTPGECVIKDGYQNMGKMIHQAEEVVVISRYTYGGFSGFIKNVFDRSLGYVLPQFEVTGGETHHKKRYDEDKPFTFVFYGTVFSEEEKESARRYVKAVCTNIRGHVKQVVFHELEKEENVVNTTRATTKGKTVLLNGSMRGENANSVKFAKKLTEHLNEETELIHLKDYVGNEDILVKILQATEVLVLCIPLYVDGLPSQIIRLMEQCQKEYTGNALKVYVLSNMGLYEKGQLRNLFCAVRQWCHIMQFNYCGGIGLSAGEMFGVIMDFLPYHFGPTKNAYNATKKLADAINDRRKMEDVFAEPFLFPRSLYIFVANTNWQITAKKNGLTVNDLYKKF